MPRKYHRLLAINTETKTGRCYKCGPVTIELSGHRSKTKWVCINRLREFRVYQKDITADQRDAMLALQQGLCAICEKPMARPQLDHSHYGDMRTREFLCVRCNIVLGSVRDNIPLLVKMILYIRKHKS